MRILVCGGRAYADKPRVFHVLDRVLHERGLSVIIHGGAAGADALAGQWASAKGITIEIYRADWKNLGKRAGPMRNQRMLIEGRPDAVIAFPGGRGTQDMIRRAEQAGLPVWVIKPR